MHIIVFWFNLFCMVVFLLSIMAEHLVPGKIESWTSYRLFMKLSLLAWLLNYSVLYFFFAFFPETSDIAIIIFTMIGVIAGSLLVFTLWLYSRSLLLEAPYRINRIAVSLGLIILAPGIILPFTGVELLMTIYLHLYYFLVIIISLSALFPLLRRKKINRFEKRTIVIVAIFFPVIWIDHLYLDLTLVPNTDVSEGIISVGALCLILAFFDLKKVFTRTKPIKAVYPNSKVEIPPLVVSTFGFTPREAEIGAYIAAGLSGKEIAEKLYISLKTVEAHTYNIYRKCSVSRRTAFTALLRRYGL